MKIFWFRVEGEEAKMRVNSASKVKSGDGFEDNGFIKTPYNADEAIGMPGRGYRFATLGAAIVALLGPIQRLIQYTSWESGIIADKQIYEKGLGNRGCWGGIE